MKVFKFAENFNNKLDCKFFTTFRLSSKWKVSDSIIMCNNKFKIGRIVDAKPVLISHLTDWHCYLDAGMDRIETLALLNSFYKIDVNSSKEIIYYYLVTSIDIWHDMEGSNPLFELESE